MGGPLVLDSDLRLSPLLWPTTVDLWLSTVILDCRLLALDFELHLLFYIVVVAVLSVKLLC